MNETNRGSASAPADRCTQLLLSFPENNRAVHLCLSAAHNEDIGISPLNRGAIAVVLNSRKYGESGQLIQILEPLPDSFPGGHRSRSPVSNDPRQLLLKFFRNLRMPVQNVLLLRRVISQIE